MRLRCSSNGFPCAACRFGLRPLRGRCLWLLLARLIDVNEGRRLMKGLNLEEADGSVACQLLRGVLSSIHSLQAASTPICLDGGPCQFVHSYRDSTAVTCRMCWSTKPTPSLAANELVAALPSAAELAKWGSK